jgi:hypothetical protein
MVYGVFDSAGVIDLPIMDSSVDKAKLVGLWVSWYLNKRGR